MRNVGHLMKTPAVIGLQGTSVSEGLLDALMTVLAASVNQSRPNYAPNSEFGSIYVVKPKMRGSQQFALTNAIFDEVERALQLPQHCIKLRIMDEERRTSVNLRQSIEAAKFRVAFINTGFLDRTGDEIHTHMRAGAVVPKAQMKNEPWLDAYEKIM